MATLSSARAWVQSHDRNYSALRRAGRAAIIMPALFALGDKVIKNSDIATLAAFGSFAMLLLVDFTGPLVRRLQAQTGLIVTGAVFVCLGTLASRWTWLATVGMVVVGFVVIFAGVVSSELAGASTALLLSFILPVSLPAPASAVPDRLAGWALAGGVSLIAISLLWPAPSRDPLRAPATAACRALAVRLRSEVARRLAGPGAPSDEQHAEVVAAAEAAVAGLHQVFLATPYRPTGLSTSARMLVRLVDELRWLDELVIAAAPRPADLPPSQGSCTVKSAAADVLDRGAELLADPRHGLGEFETALSALHAAMRALEVGAGAELPVRRLSPDGEEGPGAEFLSSLDPGFRARELGFAVSQVALNIERATLAERRTWWQRVLGHSVGTLMSAQERASAHLTPNSVWLHNSLRGAAGLGLAILVARLTGAQHAFWVVLGALSVLRSNALATGQNAVRGLVGTAIGFAVGSLLLWGIGTDTTVLWWLLPLAILLAGFAPAAISFAAGQSAFTVTLVILYNIIAPAGWRVGLLRIEDIALGCGVSLAVGLLFWPRGAAAALGRALSEAFETSAYYLVTAVEFGLARCDPATPPEPPPTADAQRAAAAGRRLDDAFRNYLAERGAKGVPLAELSGLLTGVVGLRLAGDAVLDLWSHDDGAIDADRAAARQLLRVDALRLRAWYDDLARALAGTLALPEPLEHDKDADARFVAAVRRDLQDPDGNANALAVRMIWTGDHLDAARHLQRDLIEPAGLAVAAARRPALLR